MADWLMVIITAIYVVATIFICRANIKAAEATREQLAESKRQFDEENRPIVEIEFVYERRQWYIIRFKNNGKCTASKVRIEFTEDFIDSLSEDSFKKILNDIKNKECIIGVGQHYDLFIGSNKLRDNPNKKPALGKITYYGNSREFATDIFIDLEHYMTFFSTDTDQSDLLESINNCTKELKRISSTIAQLKEIPEEEEDEEEDV